jgi:hypothetical protein
MSDPRDMSGVWYGRYVSNSGDQDNGFIALLEETGGAFSGSISEPDGQGGIRTATVSGQRSAGLIRFVKQYDAPLDHAVFYEGQVDERGTQAVGMWRLDDGTVGGFDMEREKFSSDALEEAEEEVEEVPAGVFFVEVR